jgi:hypothetical protein
MIALAARMRVLQPCDAGICVMGCTVPGFESCTGHVLNSCRCRSFCWVLKRGSVTPALLRLVLCLAVDLSCSKPLALGLSVPTTCT